MKSNLNKNQKEAVELGLGPAMILAGPGSGKTTVLLYRIQYLINELNISPQNILVITFTKAAALQMQKRAETILNLNIERPYFGTFHSYFYSFLKQTNEYRYFSIITTKQKYRRLEQILKIKYPNEIVSNNLIKELLACISKQKNGMECSEEIKSIGFTIENFEAIQRTYDYLNTEDKLMDYDDIILLSLKYLKNNPESLNILRNKIKYTLVDEFQDVNKIQFDLITLLAGKCGNLFVVGDDDQSIYGFRGALGDIFKEFINVYPKVNKVILTENYRCPKEVVTIAKALIENNESRFFKELVSVKSKKGEVYKISKISVTQERHFIISQIKELLKRERGETIAILCRTNSQLMFFSQLLKKEKIKFYMPEKVLSLYESTYVKPIIGYLMYACKEDRSRKRLFSFLNKPLRGISREVFGDNEKVNDLTMNFAMMDNCDKQTLFHLKEQLESIGKMTPKMAITYILKGIGYEKYIMENSGSIVEIRRFKEDISKLLEIAEEYISIKQWMKEVLWEECEESAEKPKIIEKGILVYLYTFHGAKGLEFENVFIPHLNEGSVPYGKEFVKETLEEERRMFYVAITRSSKRLYVSFTENNTKKNTVSRFIKECAITVSK